MRKLSFFSSFFSLSVGESHAPPPRSFRFFFFHSCIDARRHAKGGKGGGGERRRRGGIRDALFMKTPLFLPPSSFPFCSVSSLPSTTKYSTEGRKRFIITLSWLTSFFLWLPLFASSRSYCLRTHAHKQTEDCRKKRRKKKFEVFPLFALTVFSSTLPPRWNAGEQ